MERALQLAEAMTARGFAGGAVSHSLTQQVAFVGGLAAVLVGLLLYTLWSEWLIGLLLMIAGAALVLGLLRAAARQHPHTRYRPMPWHSQDWAIVGGALLTILAFLLPLPGHETIYYTPYPTLTMPPFALTIGAATWGLLAPAAVWFVITTPRSHEEKEVQKIAPGDAETLRGEK
jgi:energy-coupling factor transport system permease protein